MNKIEPLTGLESEILARRWGVNQKAVVRWMKSKGFKSITDLMSYGGSHEECMEKALKDFWEFNPDLSLKLWKGQSIT